jgi:GT2 family glycosyltransferase
MSAVSIITPWLNHSELIPDYERAVAGGRVIIIDNGSGPEHAPAIREMTTRLGGVYLRNEVNRGFAAANNQGLAHAGGQIILFLNNDIVAEPGFLDAVQRDVPDGSLVGPELRKVLVYGMWMPYVVGWCIAGKADVWSRLGPWDAAAYGEAFWEDNDLCLRALDAGIELLRRDWPVRHKGGLTTGTMLLWGEVYERNRATFATRVRPIYDRLRAQFLASTPGTSPQLRKP